MALSIKHDEADRLARELAAVTGESLTEAVTRALAERLERERRRHVDLTVLDDIARIQCRVARIRVQDERPADEILGYDEHGLPR